MHLIISSSSYSTLNIKRLFISLFFHYYHSPFSTSPFISMAFFIMQLGSITFCQHHDNNEDNLWRSFMPSKVCHNRVIHQNYIFTVRWCHIFLSFSTLLVDWMCEKWIKIWRHDTKTIVFCFWPRFYRVMLWCRNILWQRKT